MSRTGNVSGSRIRQGQCKCCKVGWHWEARVLLRNQRCPECGGGLGRIAWVKLRDEEARRVSGYVWMAVEGYVAGSMSDVAGSMSDVAGSRGGPA